MATFGYYDKTQNSKFRTQDFLFARYGFLIGKAGIYFLINNT